MLPWKRGPDKAARSRREKGERVGVLSWGAPGSGASPRKDAAWLLCPVNFAVAG